MLRIKELEELLIEKDREINNLHNTLSTGISFDPDKRYILITENELLKEVLPKNILVLPEKYLDLNIVKNMKIMSEERDSIEYWLLKYTLNVPVSSDIISFPNGATFIGGRRVLPAEFNQLRSEVKVLRKMRLWNIINETSIEHAKKLMFENATTFEGIRFGKMFIYALETQNSIMDSIERETLDEKMQKVVKLK